MGSVGRIRSAWDGVIAGVKSRFRPQMQVPQDSTGAPEVRVLRPSKLYKHPGHRHRKLTGPRTIYYRRAP